MAKSVKLNNGEIIKPKGFSEGRAKILMQILKAVRERLGYTPSLEDAKRLPDMPKDMSLYDKYYGSYQKACRQLAKEIEKKNGWRKMTEEEKQHLKTIEQQKVVSNYAKDWLKVNNYQKEGDDMGKKKVSPERKEELLRAVVSEYHFNNDTMPSTRKLKKSHLFRLYELWEAFGNYENLCKIVAKEVGEMIEVEEMKQQEVEVVSMKEESELRTEVAPVEEQNEVCVEVEEENVMSEPKKEKRRYVKRRVSIEDVIKNLNEYYAKYGELPIQGKLKKAREAGEKWLDYNTFSRRLGKKEGWMKYINNVTDDEVKTREDIEGQADGVCVQPLMENVDPVDLDNSEMEDSPIDGDQAVKPLEIHLKLSLTMPGLSSPLELSFDVTSE